MVAAERIVRDRCCRVSLRCCIRGRWSSLECGDDDPFRSHFRLAERHPQLTAKDIDLAVKAIAEAKRSTLAKGGRVEIRGCGSFDLIHRAPRKGPDPKTSETVFVPAKRAPHFTAGKELRTRMDSSK
ncbi:MAG: HU family DNA-binding protein [Candidatus Accumulibacter sp.]|nr:HU family DNA-binding protein [Accumulibacter sp.]